MSTAVAPGPGPGPPLPRKEHVGGVTIIEAPDLDVALEWARKMAQATTGRNRAIDRLRREATRGQREDRAVQLQAADEPMEEGAVRDDPLRLISTCCHPALASASQVALTLRLLGGFTTAEIARASLCPETTMAQRLIRAKAKIRDARIRYRIPSARICRHGWPRPWPPSI